MSWIDNYKPEPQVYTNLSPVEKTKLINKMRKADEYRMFSLEGRCRKPKDSKFRRKG